MDERKYSKISNKRVCDIMKAIILAGGKGARLAPYTMILPKPLVPLGHKPILDIIIRQLHHYGF